MTVPGGAVVTSAVIDRLAAGTVLPVGDGRRPDGGGWQGQPAASEFRTYLVVYPITRRRNGPDASLADPLSDPVHGYQVTAVGVDRLAAETALDLAASALLGVPLDIDGQDQVLLVHEFSGGVERDEDVNPPLFFGVDRYRVDTSTTT